MRPVSGLLWNTGGGLVTGGLGDRVLALRGGTAGHPRDKEVGNLTLNQKPAHAVVAALPTGGRAVCT